ncbi:MAG: hypothetical protein F4Z29_00680 [Gemmatimonadetes bacterium]|nr:hypothetical protein [Gemmatimonadota bacterium]
MTYTWWSWGPLDKTGYRELEVEFTIHNNPEPFPEDNPFNGLYMMLGWGKLAGHSFYFGIQSNMTSPVSPYGGFNHGILFSRWDTRDLALARWHETEGWSQSSGLEGDFIGVRRLYDWGPGDYRLRLASEETTDEGEWYGLWITDIEDDETTWIGSLAFPAESAIYGNGYSTMEVYGEPVHPEDIPYWHVSIKLPKADGREPEMVYLGYSQFTDQVSNSDIQYDADERRVHMKAGGPTERIGQAGDVYIR